MRDGGYSPFEEMGHLSEIEFALGHLPDGLGGFYSPQGSWAAIVVDRRLHRVERRVAVTHELVHHLRGGGSCHPDPVVAARDEHAVHTEVARKMVPLDRLRAFCERMVELEGAVEVWQVAEEFDVTNEVAERALALMRGWGEV